MPTVKNSASKSNRLTEKQTSSHTAVTESFRSEGISGGHPDQSDTARAGSMQQAAQDYIQSGSFSFFISTFQFNFSGQLMATFDYLPHQEHFSARQVFKRWANHACCFNISLRAQDFHTCPFCRYNDYKAKLLTALLSSQLLLPLGFTLKNCTLCVASKLTNEGISSKHYLCKKCHYFRLS